jgi:chitosanase
MITADNKQRILSVVNIFETGTPDGEYDDISIFNDGKGNTRQITFGRSQTTEQGNLKQLIQAYIANKGMFSNDFKPYVDKIGVIPLVDDKDFIALLKRSAQEDETMIKTQDTFFDKVYYQPALKFFTDNGFTFPLSMLVIYDSYIHSGRILDFLRQRFSESPPAKGGDEKAWIKAYVKTRHEWLSGKSEPLNKTIYRTKLFMSAIDADDWNLNSPLVANGTRSRSANDEMSTSGLIEIIPVRGYNRWGLRRR